LDYSCYSPSIAQTNCAELNFSAVNLKWYSKDQLREKKIQTGRALEI